MRIAATVCLILLAAAPAIAQEASTLVSDLRRGVPCQPSAARSAIEANIGKATAPAADVDKALTEISVNTSICNSLRDAAAEIGKSRAGGNAGVAASSSPSPGLPEG